MNKTNNKLNIISYNLKQHKASLELAGLVEKYNADVLCVQECDSEKIPDSIGKLTLADKTKYNRLDLAIYYKLDRFQAMSTHSFPLRKSFHDKIFAPAHEQLLVTKFNEKNTGSQILIGSFHAACMTALNSTRRKQINEAYQKLALIGGYGPTIMVGDYNYPVFKRGLRVHIEKSGYQLSRSDKPTYYLGKLLRGGHYDLATSINTTIEQVKTLPKGLSDHSPILVQALV